MTNTATDLSRLSTESLAALQQQAVDNLNRLAAAGVTEGPEVSVWTEIHGTVVQIRATR